MAPGPPGSAGARAELGGEVESSRGFLRAAANPARERGRVPLSDNAAVRTRTFPLFSTKD